MYRNWNTNTGLLSLDLFVHTYILRTYIRTRMHTYRRPQHLSSTADWSIVWSQRCIHVCMSVCVYMCEFFSCVEQDVACACVYVYVYIHTYMCVCVFVENRSCVYDCTSVYCEYI